MQKKAKLIKLNSFQAIFMALILLMGTLLTVETASAETTAPVLQAAVVNAYNAAQPVILTFSEELDESSIPAASDFKFYYSNNENTIISFNTVTVDGNQVKLDLTNNTTSITACPSLRIDYTPGVTNQLTGLNGNPVAGFTGATVLREYTDGTNPLENKFLSIYAHTIMTKNGTAGSGTGLSLVYLYKNSIRYFSIDAAGKIYDVNGEVDVNGTPPQKPQPITDVSITPVFLLHAANGFINKNNNDAYFGINSDEWKMVQKSIHIVKEQEYPDLANEVPLSILNGAKISLDTGNSSNNADAWVNLESPAANKLEYATNYKIIVDKYNYDPATGHVSGLLLNGRRVIKESIVMEFTTVEAPTISSVTINGSDLALAGLPQNSKAKEYYLDATGSTDISSVTWTDFSAVDGAAAITIADPATVTAGTSKLYWRYKADTINNIAQTPGEAVSAIIQQGVPQDTTAPALQTAQVNGVTLTLTYDEALDSNSVPANTDYVVHAGSGIIAVNSVAISGTTVTLTLATPVVNGVEITLDYTKGTSPLQDAASNDVDDLAGQTVANDSPSPKYTITANVDNSYDNSQTNDGITCMTVKDGVSGFKYFTVNISPVVAHSGSEVVVFVQLRNGMQLTLSASKADFDVVNSAQAGFNVQAGDVVKAYIVDELTNATDQNPIIFQ